MEKNHMLALSAQKEFAVKDYLTSHMKVHSEIREFAHPCDQCKHSFTTSSKLKAHKEIHMGVKPFKCQECEKSFLRPHTLSVHISSHSNDKPHSCSKCDKSYRQLNHLKLHFKGHHMEESPYRCKECNTAFTASGSLKGHFKTKVLKISTQNSCLPGCFCSCICCFFLSLSLASFALSLTVEPCWICNSAWNADCITTTKIKQKKKRLIFFFIRPSVLLAM